MNPDEYTRMYQLEDRYWWFVGRRRLALRLLRKALGAGSGVSGLGSRVTGLGSRVPDGEVVDPKNPTPHPRPQTLDPTPPRILDLGCGTGVILGEMTQWAEPIGLDISELALKFCQKRGLGNLVQARGEHLPIQTGSVDGVLALDIFEHIEDHNAAYKEAARVLKPGGALVLSVPAFRWLWGPHDVALMHFRRYTAAEMRRCLEDAGLQVERLSYSVFYLFPVVVLVRVLEKLKRGKPEASLPQLGSFFNNMLIGLQDVEASTIARTNLPWGSSVVAVGRKPS